MSNEELEVYVALVAKFMQLSPEQRELISGELQDHLQLRVEDLMDEGVPKSDAISQAVEEFGDAAVMAKNFQTVHKLKRRRWMMRFMTFSIAGSFLVAVLTMAMWPQNARFGSPSQSIAQEQASPDDTPASKPVTTTASTSTQLNERAEKALKQSVHFDFDEEDFTSIKETLEAQSGLNFILTTSASDDSLPDDELFTFKVSGVPLSKALDLMLAPKNATYVIDSGVVMLISLDEADDERWHRLKMFDCRELVKVLPKTSPPVRLLVGRGFTGGGGGVFAITPQFGGGGKTQAKDKKPPSESQLLDAKLEKILLLMEKEATRRRPAPSGEYTLKELIRSMISSETWASEAGSGAIDVVNGIVIVRNSERGLKQVEDMLIDLEGKLLPQKAARLQPPTPKAQPPKRNGTATKSSSKPRPSSDPFAPDGATGGDAPSGN